MDKGQGSTTKNTRKERDTGRYLHASCLISIIRTTRPLHIAKQRHFWKRDFQEPLIGRDTQHFYSRPFSEGGTSQDHTYGDKTNICESTGMDVRNRTRLNGIIMSETGHFTNSESDSHILRQLHIRNGHVMR